MQRINLSPGAWLGLGLPLIAPALCGMALFESLTAFIVANVIMGFGRGFAGAGFSAGASLAVRPEEQGAASGIIAACSSAGWIVGPLLGPGALSTVARIAVPAYGGVCGGRGCPHHSPIVETQEPQASLSALSSSASPSSVKRHILVSRSSLPVCIVINRVTGPTTPITLVPAG